MTTSTPASAANFGLTELPAHDLRYRMADECVEVVKGLWDTWESGARVADPETGVYLDPGRIHRLDHEGEFYSVRGPLNASRCPQGQPVIVQAGSVEERPGLRGPPTPSCSWRCSRTSRPRARSTGA